LFQERYVCAAWQGNPEIGDTLTRDEFCRIPQLGNVPGHLGGLPETRLEQLGIHRNVEIMTQTFVMPPLVRGTRLLAIVHERVALELAPGAEARILDVPFDLGIITQTMYWHPRMGKRSRPPVAQGPNLRAGRRPVTADPPVTGISKIIIPNDHGFSPDSPASWP